MSALRARRLVGLAVEGLGPLLLLAILLDSTRQVGWVAYERDPSIYGSIARLWEIGFIPYRDVWEFKPPLIFVALRTGFALWGYEPENLRRVFLIATWLGASVMYLGLRRAGGAVAAPVAALGLMTLVVVNPWGLPLQNTESLVVAFGACAIGCAAAHQRTPRWWWALLTGASLGLATTGKQPAAFFALPLGLQLCLWGAPAGWRARAGYVLQRALLGLAGFASVIAAFALYFARHDALGAMYEAVLIDGARYSQSLGVGWLLPPTLWQRIPPAVTQFTRPQAGWPFLTCGYLWPFFGAVAALPLLTLLRPCRWVFTAWAWLAAAWMAMCLGPFGENHYAVMTLPALALTLGVVCELCWPRAWAARGAAAPRVLAGLAIAALLLGPPWREQYWPRRSQHPGVNQIEQEAQRLGGAIRAAARPGDTILVDDEPLQIYLYAALPPATRFIYWNAPNARAAGERKAALEQQPAFVFLSRGTEAQRQAALERQPSQPDWMAQHYDRWLTSPVGAVYRRRGGASAVTTDRPGS